MCRGSKVGGLFLLGEDDPGEDYPGVSWLVVANASKSQTVYFIFGI